MLKIIINSILFISLCGMTIFSGLSPMRVYNKSGTTEYLYKTTIGDTESTDTNGAMYLVFTFIFTIVIYFFIFYYDIKGISDDLINPMVICYLLGFLFLYISSGVLLYTHNYITLDNNFTIWYYIYFCNVLIIPVIFIWYYFIKKHFGIICIRCLECSGYLEGRSGENNENNV